MYACSRIETKLRPTEEQVGKKWDIRAGRFLRVLRPTGELVCEKLGRFLSRVMSAGRQSTQQEDRRPSPRVGVSRGAGTAGRPVRRLVSAQDALVTTWAVRTVRMEGPR